MSPILAVLTLSLLASTQARNIVFPSLSPLNSLQGQTLLRAEGNHDAAFGIKFAGLTTFANLPYVFCLSDEEDVDRYDIAFLGAPFDTGTTGRPGARFGPSSIRAGSKRILPDFARGIYTETNPFQSWAKIVDCGDASLTWLDNTFALNQLDEAHKIISGRKSNASEYGAPRTITFGGDHTTTLSALRSTFDHWGAVSVIHFDSHIDTWNPDAIGGGISEYAGVNHGTFLHIAAEEGLVKNSSIHAGIRAPLGSKSDLRNDKHCGFEIVTARAIHRIGVSGIVERLKKRVEGSRVYITVDIDVLDPAFAPGTGTAEVGGWSTRELLSILDGLDGLELIGADVVEVAPAYDNAGETTALAAAEIARILMELMVNKPVKSNL